METVKVAPLAPVPALNPFSPIFVLHEVRFAIVFYGLAAIAGIAISLGSALFGHPLVTFEPKIQQAPVPPAVPTADPLRPDMKMEDFIKSIDVEVARREPKEKVNEQLMHFFSAYANTVDLPKEPAVGDLLPEWVTVKPLPTNAQSVLSYTGAVAQGREASGVVQFNGNSVGYGYTGEASLRGHMFFVFTDHSRRVVGVIPGGGASSPHQ